MQVFTNRINQAILISLSLVVIVLLFYVALPIGIDWNNAYKAAHDLRHYDQHGFIGLPVSLLFLPHALLPLRWGNAINFALNLALPMLVLGRHRVGMLGVLAIYGSPPFFVAMTVNNIDWVPLLGFLLPPSVGVVFIAVKPQVLGGLIVVWIKRHGMRVAAALPVMALIILLVWGLKPLQVMRHVERDVSWNFAPWPYLIPVGVWLLWKAWQNEDEFLAAGATPMLVPYIAGYTLPMTMTVVACKYPRVAALITLLMWWLVVVEHRRYG